LVYAFLVWILGFKFDWFWFWRGLLVCMYWVGKRQLWAIVNRLKLKCHSWFFCISSVIFKPAQNKNKINKKTQQTSIAEQNPSCFDNVSISTEKYSSSSSHWSWNYKFNSTMCLYLRKSTAHHHHIDHEITSSIQAVASFDVS